MNNLSVQDFAIGRQLLSKGLPSVFFSQRTYQIEVRDEDESSVWVFLGLNEEGELADYFCQCDNFEKHQSCPHVAASYLFAFLNEHKSLSSRYLSSLWYILFFIAARRHGFSPKVEKKGSGFVILSSTGKELFSFKSKSKEKLSELVFERQKETEETSIKFSNLDSHELKLYKEGRASIQFQFELSFFSDLSKWIMVLEAGKKPFTLQFDEGEMGLPSLIRVCFEEVEFSMYLAKSNWEEILHFLKNHNSPLPVYESGDFDIKEMHYDKQRARITLKKEALKVEQSDVVDLGDWYFRRGFGFFPKKVDPLFANDEIEDIALLFRSHLDLVERKLKNEKIHLEKLEPHYHLFMDNKGCLHISLYVFKKGDLSHGKGIYFHPWAFIDGFGFTKLKQPLFEEVEKVIKREKMGEFITEYRAWLSTFEGFETHLSHMESTLSYEVRDDHTLRFFTGEISENKDTIDLGEWLWVKGQGFFAKNRGGAHSFLKSGMQVESYDVSGFIRSHEPELELVQGFFSRRSPILKMGLDIRYNDNGIIEVMPKVSYTAGYSSDRVQLFGEYAYIKGEGFSRTSEKALLPVGYEKAKEIPSFLEQHFLFQELPDLMPYIFEIDPRLVRPESLKLKIEGLELDSKRGLWKLRCHLQSEIGKSRIEPLFHAACQQKPFLPTSSGLILIKDFNYHWLAELKEQNIQKDGLKISSIQWIHILAYQDIEFDAGCDAELVRVLKQFTTHNLSELDMPPLVGLKTTLRPYQEMGIRWIYNLYRNHLSGILADEMGLGKTHQAMGLIAAAMNHPGGKYFVVCPTSVIYHWENLLRDFLPDICFRVYYGPERSLEGEWDLLLTSYGTLRGDIQKIKKIPFEIAIFDEMQSAKNKHSQIHKSLKSLNSVMKMGLTGTPIENDLTELKALFDILIPSLFPSDDTFRELFINPIERGENKDRYHLLKKLVSPFILRRKKSEVLQDLPEKIEEISYVDLSDEQRVMYNQILKTGFHELEELEKGEKPRLYLHIFALLLKLKQVCDHPCLITKQVDDYEQHSSGKFELFKELLEEARQSGQKVVVFTQYIDMLRIIKKYLDKEGIGSAMIHGQVKDRRGEVERFKDDPKCEVFIASLGAAGVGIDLTQASVVIHYDRWWNPARENQATDRVHRYGQTRGVQVFKFVCKNTIEEHIHAIIEKKQSLMQDVIGFDDENHLKKIDPKELMEMMRKISS